MSPTARQPAGFRIYLRERPGELGFGYRIAGRTLNSALEFPHLAAFAAPAQPMSGRRALPRPTGAGSSIFSGPAFVGGRDRQLDCRRAGEVTTVTIEDMGSYDLDLDEGTVACPKRTPVETVEQALCGPCLPLLLAAAGDYLLHAAAVRLPGGVVAITGRSGAGKSTLAAAWVARGDAVALADDALSVRLGRAGIHIPGTYPQLKWPRWGGDRSREAPAPLLGVVELEPGDSGVELVPLSGQQALLVAAGGTVAARLFDPDLLQRHFGFCRELAARVPCWRLHYAPQLRNLPAMIECLKKRCQR